MKMMKGENGKMYVALTFNQMRALKLEKGFQIRLTLLKYICKITL